MDKNNPSSAAVIAAESAAAQSKWRGSPFWALNGKLSPDEIRRQIRGFRKQGLGGFFLHSRTGLQTPYLSEEFFESIAAAVDEAEKQNMQAWLYDEDRFPSGFGGGMITCDPAYRAKAIFLEELPAGKAESITLPETLVACFSATTAGDTARNIRRLSPNELHTAAPGETLLLFYTDIIKCSSWYNNYTYLDTINPDAVRAFINLTHEAYKKRFSSKFGTVIPGMFTDEPRYGFLLNQPGWDVEKRYALPWTPGLLEEFREQHGFDAVDHLVEYFFDVPETDAAAARWCYVETLTRRFIKAYAKQIGDWCKENDLLFTGHTVAEDNPSYQTLCVGSSMRFYEHMGMPGIDLLTEHHRAYQTAKQLSSAARQFGKERRLVECYGCTGWDFPVIGFYALGNWLYALGMNFRCQHLAFYTMEGEAKRDYPCPVALHSNAPAHYRAMEDHFARLTPWLSHGEEKRNILLIHAVESAWTLFHRNWRGSEKSLAFDRKFTEISHKLLAHQQDFDYADEEILSRYGEINDRNIKVGEAQYQVVVVPELITIRRTTLELLARFRAQGGKVYCVSAPPTHVDGMPEKLDDSIFDRIVSLNELPELLQPYCELSIRTPAGENCNALLVQQRCSSDWDAIFVCNTGHNVESGGEDGARYKECSVLERKAEFPEAVITIKSRHGGCAAELDTATGRYLACNGVYRDGKWTIQTSFERLSSRLFIFSSTANALPVEPAAIRDEKFHQKITVAPERWKIELSELNCALFDHFSKEIGGEPGYVLELDDELRRSLQLPERDGIMAQPWCRKPDDRTGGEVNIYAEFQCENLPLGPLFLVLERPELFRCFINETEIPLRDIGFWHEPAWRKVPILQKKVLQKGRNILQLQTRLTNAHPGLESVFLLGDFGVKENFPQISITEPVTSLKPGDWCTQGLPFYAGDVTYRVPVELPCRKRGRITVTNFNGTPLEIKVDDHDAGALLYSPGQSDTVDFPEKFELAFKITGSMRNACGPFFQPDKQPTWCGPYQFKSVKFPRRQQMPYGIDGEIEINV